MPPASRQRTSLHPKKLLLTKWTAVIPRNREKHFLVTQVIEPAVPGAPVESVELQAVLTGRVEILPWRDLTDSSQWHQGWR